MRKIFNLDNYNNHDSIQQYAMHCDEKEKAEKFCNFLHEHGLMWVSGKSYARAINWQQYKSKTCYDFVGGYFKNVDFFKNNDFTILEYDDFDWENSK